MSDFLTDVDPSRYLRPPVTDVAATVALGIALVSATHRSFPSAVRREARTLRASIVRLQEDWAAQQKVDFSPRGGIRIADGRSDRAWGAISTILQSVASLPGSVPQALVARRLHATLFPTGLRFLNLPFEKQWAECEQKLQTIEREGLGKQLASLVGAFVLTEVQEAHQEYGRVLGITDAKGDLKAPTNVLESLRAARDAMATYALQVLASAQATPELQPAARAALRPFDDYREMQSRRAVARARNAEQSEGEADDEGEELPPPSEPEDLGTGSTASDQEVSPSTPIPELDDLSESIA